LLEKLGACESKGNSPKSPKVFRKEEKKDKFPLPWRGQCGGPLLAARALPLRCAASPVLWFANCGALANALLLSAALGKCNLWLRTSVCVDIIAFDQHDVSRYAVSRRSPAFTPIDC
jgi:hypothetical protein